MKKIGSATVFVIWAVFLGFLSNSNAGDKGIHLSTGVMALMNSTVQSGNGPSGSTFLTQTEAVYHGKWWGIGAFFQYDRQGSNQVDTALGPKIEFHYGPFFISGGYGALMQRAFTDRTIANQNGSAWVIGAGTRFRLGGGGKGGGRGGGGGGGGLFFQFTYVYRIKTITHQDSSPLSAPIVQTDGYPLFGIGIIL